MKQEKVNGSPNVQALGEIDLLREFSSNGNIPFLIFYRDEGFWLQKQLVGPCVKTTTRFLLLEKYGLLPYRGGGVGGQRE